MTVMGVRRRVKQLYLVVVLATLAFSSVACAQDCSDRPDGATCVDSSLARRVKGVCKAGVCLSFEQQCQKNGKGKACPNPTRIGTQYPGYPDVMLTSNAYFYVSSRATFDLACFVLA